MESTTSELIVTLRKVANQKKLKLSKETLENLEKVLMQADLVKFAKEKPLDFEIEADKKRISNTIVTIHKAIPEVVEEDDELEAWNEQQKELARLKKLKKEKQKRTLIIVGIAIGILAISAAIFVYIKGYDNVKDYVLGNPTRELSEGEWIYSEYGNPGVKIETPKVLKRLDASKALPKETYAVLKEMQMFSYGKLSEPFYVEVATYKYKEETKENEPSKPVEINFDTVLEGITKLWESKGAQNILFKQEDFNTDKGITGTKAYGTMTVLNKEDNSTQKMYYEILLFKQDGGLQQIIVSHREGDTFGKKVLDRVINSVELKLDEE